VPRSHMGIIAVPLSQSSEQLPDSALPPEALRLLQQAHQLETPCGEGHMVWRSWGAGEPVVLLHGGSGTWTHWLRNIPALAETGRRVVAPDLPGFGDSDPPAGKPDADTCVAPLLAGLDQVLPGPPVDLAAFSFGTAVACLAALQSPQRFRRMVLLGAPIVPLRLGRGVRLAAWRHLATPEARRVVHRQNLAAMMLHRPEAIDATAVALQEINVPRDRMPGRRLVTTDAVGRALRQLHCPVWAAYGGEDAVFRERWPEVEAAWRAVPRLQDLVMFPGAGHWVQYE
jgi:2-hydroxy-6-oxonona-2,4-dienedioate hydrolase